MMRKAKVESFGDLSFSEAVPREPFFSIGRENLLQAILFFERVAM